MVDTAWETAIPDMPYEALLEYLPDFERDGMGDQVLAQVARRLVDPDHIVESGLQPYRFWQAYRDHDSYFRPALESALETSVENVPRLWGRTLFAIDTSQAMRASIDGHPHIARVQLATLFAAALQSGSRVDVITYAEKGRLVTDLPQSLLRAIRHVEARVGELGDRARTWPCIADHYRGQDRIIAVTAMTEHPGRVHGLPDVPVYVWDLSGMDVDISEPGRYLFKGFSDSAFYLIPLIEADVTSDPSALSRIVSRTGRG